LPRVLFLTWSKNQPSTKYRVHQYLDGLERDGFKTEVFLANGLTPVRRFTMLQKAKAADVVYIQKKLFHPVFLPLLKAANPNIVFDFDDAAFAREPYNPKPRGMSPGSRSAVGRLNAALKTARAVVAGNSFLAAYATRYNQRVHELPTPVDTAAGASGTGASAAGGSHLPHHGTVTIGWLGTSKNLYYLKGVTGALKQVVDECPRVKVSVLSNGSFVSEGLAIENLQWSPESESQWLSSVNVGIMPLEHDDWSRGKCAFKLLQYMAAGIATVSSPVGMNVEVIQDGANGLLADTAYDWREKLLALVRNPRLREDLGACGRRTVEEKYSLSVCRKKLGDILYTTLR
jgi:hypothetical protein